MLEVHDPLRAVECAVVPGDRPLPGELPQRVQHREDRRLERERRQHPHAPRRAPHAAARWPTASAPASSPACCQVSDTVCTRSLCPVPTGGVPDAVRRTFRICGLARPEIASRCRCRRPYSERPWMSAMTRRSWAVFAAMCVIWGIPYLLIRVAVRDIAPGTLVFLRTAPRRARRWFRSRSPAADSRPCWRAGARWSRSPSSRWRSRGCCCPTPSGKLSSSLTGLLIAAVPLVGVLVARITRSGEQFDWLQLTGLAVGLLGVAMLVGLDFGRISARPARRDAGGRGLLRRRPGDHGALARRPAEHPGGLRVAARGRGRLPALRGAAAADRRPGATAGGRWSRSRSCARRWPSCCSSR